MSSSDRAALPLKRIVAIAATVVALAGVAGCTVQPLYGETTAAIGTGKVASERLAMVEVKPESDRVGQEVRNHLIFLLGGGKGQPANPAYQLQINTSSSSAQAATIETRSALLEPTSGLVTVQSSYKLTEVQTGRVISVGLRSVQAPFDIPAQEYAAMRAERDAMNRAARELAELLRLVVGQELEKSTSLAAPAVVSSPEEIERAARGNAPAGI